MKEQRTPGCVCTEDDGAAALLDCASIVILCEHMELKTHIYWYLSRACHTHVKTAHVTVTLYQ